MKRYFKRLLSEPITTVGQAEEVVKLAAYGLYVLGFVILAEYWLISTMDEFFQIPPPSNTKPFEVILGFFFMLGTAYVMNRYKNRIISAMITIFWLGGLLYHFFVPFYIEWSSRPALNLILVLYGILLFAVGVLIASGGIRGTFRFHQLKDA